MRQYDIIIVGGGVHGAGIAYAAAAAGHSVLLLEKQTLAAGTSSKSSKLIHGGLRYLESGQLSLVRESLRERRILLQIAPELVTLKPFFIPLYPDTRRRAWQLRLGLSLYAVLGGLDRSTRFGSVPRSAWEKLDGLETRNLCQVMRYYDAQTDDAAMTRAAMRSAEALGAELAMPARFLSAQLSEDAVAVRYAQNNAEHECNARVLINAAGAWCADVADRITPSVGLPPIERIQGTHILLPGALTQGIYYVESPRDGRAVFVMPWKGNTLVGTTETRFNGNPDQVQPLLAEKHYLLSVLKHYFPRFRGTRADRLLGSFAGLRVLPAGAGHAFHRSRETLLAADRHRKPRVLGVYGGKLTGWRATAEQALTRIAESLPTRAPRLNIRSALLITE